jgi:hypothetical protein
MPFPPPDRRARLDFMPGSDIPVIRQPFEAGDVLPYWAGAGASNTGNNHLYDIVDDPDETQNRCGEPIEAEMIDLLHAALTEVEAPLDQFARLGLT